MELRIRTRTGTVSVNKVLVINRDRQDIDVSCNNNVLTLSSAGISFDSWYSRFLSRKLVAMCVGGSPDERTLFTAGLSGTIYASCVKTINNTSPSADGNLQLLPGKTLDIYPTSSGIAMEQLNIPITNISNVLEDINRCAWYLYHTYNSFLYRLHVLDIHAKTGPMFTGVPLLGTIPAYQALVAAWNIKVWRRGFLWDTSEVRETLSFSVGYMATDCVNPSVRCEVELLAEPALINGEIDTSIGYYTLYKQGVSSNVHHIVQPQIIKYRSTGSDSDGGVEVSGTGTDPLAELGGNGVWSKIITSFSLNALEQGDYYKAMFSLAIAQNSMTSETYEGLSTTEPHKIHITTTWYVTDENYVEHNYKETSSGVVASLSVTRSED